MKYRAIQHWRNTEYFVIQKLTIFGNWRDVSNESFVLKHAQEVLQALANPKIIYPETAKTGDRGAL